VAIDRIGAPLQKDDALILCSDGLYNVVAEPEMLEIVRGQPAASASRALVDAANERGTPDNVSAAVIKMIGATPEPRPRRGVLGHLARWIGRSA